MVNSGAKEQNVLVLQGGGALGAYQAGAFEALSLSSHQPQWIAGISIGAINAAIIAGNEVANRVQKLHQFWQGTSSSFFPVPWLHTDQSRSLQNEISAAMALTSGVPGFFKPRFPPPSFMPEGAPEALSYYDTSPLAKTLTALVDFDFLNEQGPRLSVGAVDIKTGNFAYFDSREIEICPEHIMASGAMPPGFPPVTINGHAYWDGGLVSNTSLQFVLEHDGKEPLCIFQIDLFSAQGALPANLFEVAQREKDIRYSSRTRLTTDRFRQLKEIGAAARRLYQKLPEDLRDDPDMAVLRAVESGFPVTLVHLIHRKESYENQSKDYEFSTSSMTEHWAAGKKDVERTLNHRDWKKRRIQSDRLQVFDLGGRDD